MALGCEAYLKSKGIEVLLSRYRDENDDLNEEIRECNAYNPDLAVDIHNNAGKADGFEVFYHHLGGNSIKLAKNIEKYVVALGQNSRGCKVRMNSKGNADYYGFIRNTKAPAVITEGLFVDNKNDVKIADTVEEQREFGVAIAKGIIDTLIVMGLYVEKTDVKYSVHVENIGWQEQKENGELAGTEGQSLRIEAIKIFTDISLKYRAHIENIGWMDFVKVGELAGTTGKSLRLECLEIISDREIKATAHVQNKGWIESVVGKTIRVGTEGEALRLEALTLEIV
jgi:N-acetylmuramoyl-L-alanine amidase